MAILGHSFDEPVAELLAAARSLPDARFVLTGAAPRGMREAAPASRLTGWLRRPEYEELLARARGAICLTTREDTMQQGAYEAAQYALPMVLSGTASLRSVFGPGVIFVADHDPETLAAACASLWEHHERLGDEAMRARTSLLRRFREEVSALRDAVEQPAGGARR